MNILILNWKDTRNPEAGGAEIIAFEFAKRLAKDDHSVTFFCRQFIGGNSSENIDGVNIVRQGNRYTVYLRAMKYYLSLSKKPDIVIDMVNTLCWMTPLYIPKQKRVLYVNQLAKEVIFYELDKPYSYLAYIIEKLEYLLYKNTKVLCYSKSTKEDLVSFGIPEKNIHTFPLGLDHKRYFPDGKKSTFPLFIFVARLVRMKRADLCIDAMKFVIAKYNTAKLYVIGNGPEEDNLQRYIKRRKLSKQVVLVNKNNFFVKKSIKDIKVKLMQKAWVLLLPSVKEGWGMVVTEAAACGTPSIVTNVTGLIDSVEKNKTGVVLSNDPSPLELAGAMIELIENKEKLHKLSTQAREKSLQLTWDKSYKKFKQLILTP